MAFARCKAAGRNRAVIIHTATGQHARELELKFADVGFLSGQEQPRDAGEKSRILTRFDCADFGTTIH